VGFEGGFEEEGLKLNKDKTLVLCQFLFDFCIGYWLDEDLEGR
jgi:hypothetical protein